MNDALLVRSSESMCYLNAVIDGFASRKGAAPLDCRSDSPTSNAETR